MKQAKKENNIERDVFILKYKQIYKYEGKMLWEIISGGERGIRGDVRSGERNDEREGIRKKRWMGKQGKEKRSILNYDIVEP